MPKTALDFLERDHPHAVDRLSEFLSIPSVSTDPAFKDDVLRGAEWVADQLREVGLEVEVHDTGGHPAVIGRTRDGDVANPDGARVMFYGHYDVQPADPLEKWESPPFEPVIKDGAIIARGASDDKGQVLCFIEALRAWRKGSAERKFPVPVTVLIEGEEECGSVHLQPFIEKHRELLACDIVLISDTTMWESASGPVPAITYGLRGLLYFDIQLHGPSRDLHSGVYGGTLANPCTILTRVLGHLFDEHHRVTIPGYYDDVATPSEAELRQWSTLGFDQNEFLGAIGVYHAYGEEGYSTLERRWSRPACDINGLYGGYMKEGAKTVIPTFAGAKVSFRLAANQDPEKIAEAFTHWLHRQPVHGLRWRITKFSQASPVALSISSPFVAAAKLAIVEACGRLPVLVREGATIPVVSSFKQIGWDSLLVGFGRADDRIHSPNEKFDLASFRMGCRIHVLMLHELSKVNLEDNQ